MKKLFKVLIFIIIQLVFLGVFTNFNIEIINPINNNVLYGVSSNSIKTYLKELFFTLNNNNNDSLYYLNNIEIYKTTTNQRHYATDGYYYGKKGQCVEFIKRYYHDYLKHDFPNVWGNAKSFYDKNIKNGELNKDRNLYQYKNGNINKPNVNDIIVFAGSYYGHVAIVACVTEDYIIIKQQNCLFPTKKIRLTKNNNKYYINYNKCKGWLSLK